MLTRSRRRGFLDIDTTSVEDLEENEPFFDVESNLDDAESRFWSSVGSSGSDDISSEWSSPLSNGDGGALNTTRARARSSQTWITSFWRDLIRKSAGQLDALVDRIVDLLELLVSMKTIDEDILSEQDIHIVA
jgi:hypothetical protein